MSKLRLTGSTSGFTELTEPAVAGSNTLTLPTGNGTAGQFLQTNGSGALSFASAGKILQVAQTAKTDTASESISANSVGSTDLISVSITPSSSSNKILVFYNVNIGASYDYQGTVLCRGGSVIFRGDSAGSRPRSTTVNNNPGYAFVPINHNALYLDSPSSTSSLTYSVRGMNGDNGSVTYYINRSSTDTDTFNRYRTASSITVMEVAA